MATMTMMMSLQFRLWGRACSDKSVKTTATRGSGLHDLVRSGDGIWVKMKRTAWTSREPEMWAYFIIKLATWHWLEYPSADIKPSGSMPDIDSAIPSRLSFLASLLISVVNHVFLNFQSNIWILFSDLQTDCKCLWPMIEIKNDCMACIHGMYIRRLQAVVMACNWHDQTMPVILIVVTKINMNVTSNYDWLKWQRQLWMSRMFISHWNDEDKYEEDQRSREIKKIDLIITSDHSWQKTSKPIRMSESIAQIQMEYYYLKLTKTIMENLKPGNNYADWQQISDP